MQTLMTPEQVGLMRGTFERLKPIAPSDFMTGNACGRTFAPVG